MKHSIMLHFIWIFTTPSIGFLFSELFCFHLPEVIIQNNIENVLKILQNYRINLLKHCILVLVNCFYQSKHCLF